MGKRAYILKLLQDVRASYWFLPTILVFVGLALAGMMGWVDRNAAQLPITLPDSYVDAQADGARSTLAVISQSIIGVAGVMFSMTLVAVSFASGNFGPRLIGNFMRDRGNQWSLGILISTFVYALIVLRSVQDGADGGAAEYVPQYSLIVALFLTLVCVFTLIYFVHHIPETINVSRISSNIGASLEQQLRAMIDSSDGTGHTTAPITTKPDETVVASVSGYIQTVNFDQLEDLAEEHDLHINMVSSIGSFLTEKTTVFEVWTSKPLDEDLRDKLKTCFAVGVSRTEYQNPTFLAEKLVEMVARALSPGVNDPYTAMDCLNHMSSGLTIASAYKSGLTPPRHTRVSFPFVTFENLFSSSIVLCRQYIVPDDMTRKHTETILENLSNVVRPSDQTYVLEELKILRSAG